MARAGVLLVIGSVFLLSFPLSWTDPSLPEARAATPAPLAPSGAAAAVPPAASVSVASPAGQKPGPVYGPSPAVTEEQVTATATQITKKAADDLAKVQDENLATVMAEMKRQADDQRQELEARLRAAEEVVGRQDAVIARLGEVPRIGTARAGLLLTGFVQADGAIRQSSQDQANPSTGAPLNQDRVSIRRARLRAVLERTYVAGALELDGNTTRGATARLIGAEASLRWPGPSATDPTLAMVTIGLFKTPFGFEVLQSDRDRLFMERSTAERGLFPGEYDAGMRLQGGWRFLRYVVGVMNGEPLGESGSFAGLDPNHHKDIVGRLGVDTPVTPSVAVSAGLSGLVGKGFHPGTSASKPSLIWQDRNEDGQFQTSEIQLAPGVSPTSAQSFGRHALGADLQVMVAIAGLGAASAFLEGYLAENLDRGILPADPYALVSTSYGPVARNMREIGWYLGLTQDLGAHATVGVRYDYYNPDRDSADRVLGAQVPSSFSYHTWALAAALRAPAGRLIAEVDLNRNHLGRDASGAPTNLRDNAFLIRGEVKF